MKRLSRSLSGSLNQAKHAGRSRSHFMFHISEMSAVGGPLPMLDDCGGVKLRLWRNNKFYDTDEAELVSDGHVTWSGMFHVPCSLFNSGKTGKSYSAKVFNVSLLSKHGKRLREIARGEVDLSSFVVSAADAAAGSPISTLKLSPRADLKGGGPVALRWRVHAAAALEGVNEDDDDDELSRADSASTLASGTIVTAMEKQQSSMEQDLGGFEPALEPITSGMLAAIAQAAAPSEELERVTEGPEDEAGSTAPPTPNVPHVCGGVGLPPSPASSIASHLAIASVAASTAASAADDDSGRDAGVGGPRSSANSLGSAVTPSTDTAPPSPGLPPSPASPRASHPAAASVAASTAASAADDNSGRDAGMGGPPSSANSLGSAVTPSDPESLVASPVTSLSGQPSEASTVLHLGDDAKAVLPSGQGLAAAQGSSGDGGAAGGAASAAMTLRNTAPTPAPPIPAAPIKAGWLRKRAVSAPAMLKNWRLRYVVLTSNTSTIMWFKSEPTYAHWGYAPSASSSAHEKAQGQIHLGTCLSETSCAIMAEGPPRLIITAGRRELQLEAEDRVELEEWRNAVQACIEAECEKAGVQPANSVAPAPPKGCAIL